jgi:LPXTG-motif cell wall-anchored protein
MKKFQILIVLAVIAALLVPVSARAAGYFYCTTLKDTGGNGTYSNPWGCATDQEFNRLLNDVVCHQYYGGVMYRIYSDAYIIYTVQWLSTQQGCNVTASQRYPGYPPNTGPDLSAPLLLGGAVVVGVALLAGGLALRRKKQLA